MSRDEAAEPGLPPTKKRKKKRPGPEQPVEPKGRGKKARAARDVALDRMPAFARAFPRDRELDRLVSAFEAGDYRLVRAEAPKLAHATDRDDVRRAARELARRIEPDPMMVYLLAIAGALLVALAGWYWTHPEGPAHGGAQPPDAPTSAPAAPAR